MRGQGASPSLKLKRLCDGSSGRTGVEAQSERRSPKPAGWRDRRRAGHRNFPAARLEGNPRSQRRQPLAATLDALVVQVHFEASQVDDGGVTCHTLRIPSGKGTTELTYAFSDGYMVVGSSREAVAEAVQLHRSGGSLAKSTKFIASLRPGRQMEASASLYEDPLAMAHSACGRLSQFFLNTSLSTEVTLLRR
jgi:hypothetical protein